VHPEADVAIKVFGLGTVEARVLTKIGFKVAGTLTELRVDHGDRVAASQVLARIDAGEQTARVAKARAQVLSAEASVQVAEAAAKKATALVTQRARVNQRRQSLLARQSVSEEAAEDAQLNEGVARADLLVAQSEIEAAKAKLDDARAQFDFENVILNQHELRAPFDGIVVARAKELGSVMAVGETLFTVVAPETVWMLAYIDEARAGDIEEGQHVEIKLRSLPQDVFTG
jgi:HlyD family secretion protein